MANAQPPIAAIDLPASLPAAGLRGALGQCPRCGEAVLFRKWLKPVDTCGHCQQDWSIQQADDFPAYIGIFVSGHVLAPVVIAMIGRFGMSPWLTLAIILPVALIMCIALLQPSKGAVIAILWWFGVGGFRQERREDIASEEDIA
ncbi:DUF983 domain-containing protein [Erythrobacter insulae]|uniref:DUF983 domain-containing protein n=1 Tax=Erythrobacter insulae TaxID=2584124 RepID=A0A547PC50_9SPHN|nr:DUF983 domain-containing protein [Erythrobacter insulae]TRD11718.1 DUF983 domain-containing protein [Erythrobacter insulae]